MLANTEKLNKKLVSLVVNKQSAAEITEVVQLMIDALVELIEGILKREKLGEHELKLLAALRKNIENLQLLQKNLRSSGQAESELVFKLGTVTEPLAEVRPEPSAFLKELAEENKAKKSLENDDDFTP